MEKHIIENKNIKKERKIKMARITVKSQDFNKNIKATLSGCKPKSAMEITLILRKYYGENLSLQKVKSHLKQLLDSHEIKKGYAFGRAFFSLTTMYEKIEAL